MFLDALLLVSDAQAITADAVSTNTIDLGNPTIKNQIGTGEAMGFACSIDVAADFTAGDETYTIQAISSAAANLSSPTVIGSRTLTGASERAAGFKFFIPIPPGTPSQRYLGLNYDVGGTTPTVTITAGLIPASFFESWLAYSKNYAL